jgi:tetratricopeptide (TPR) repeat protein
MNARRRQTWMGVLCAVCLGCHGSAVATQPAAPRVHPVQPGIKPATNPADPEATDTSGPGLVRPRCPADQSHLDAAAKAYDARLYDLALACAEDELLEDPGSAEAEQQRGLALAALGKIDDARLALLHALALDPDDPETLADAADLYLTHGNVTRELDEIALEYARRGERGARRHRPELLEQLDLLQGMALNDLGRFDEALEKLDQTLERDPKDLDARYEHAVALFELCRFAPAKADLKQVLAELPDDAFGHHELGLALERLGDDKQARAELARATALDPEAFPADLPVRMDEFKEMVGAAIQALPPQLRRDLTSVKLSAEEMPELSDLTVDQPPLSPTILGLFRGEPLGDSSDDRSGPSGQQPGSDPRAILLYRRNLVRVARSRAELAKQIEITLWHELGHLRGADDDELRLRGLE